MSDRACLSFLQFVFKIAHVSVAIAETLRFRQANAVDDAGVVQLIRDDGVICSEQRLEQASVCIKARAVEDRVFRAEKLD